MLLIQAASRTTNINLLVLFVFCVLLFLVWDQVQKRAIRKATQSAGSTEAAAAFVRSQPRVARRAIKVAARDKVCSAELFRIAACLAPTDPEGRRYLGSLLKSEPPLGTGWATDSLPWQAAQLLSDLGSEKAKKWLSDAQSGLTQLAEERQREIARKAEIERRRRTDAKKTIEECLHDWRSVSDGFDGENSFLVCRRCCIQVTDQGYSNGQLERGIPSDPRVKWFSPDGTHLQLIEIEKELLRAVLLRWTPSVGQKNGRP